MFRSNSFVSVKVFTNKRVASEHSLLKGLKYIRDQNIKIVVLPFGSYSPYISIKNQIREMAIDGFLFISTAGNQVKDKKDMMWPGRSKWVLTIGSLALIKEKVSNFSIKAKYFLCINNSSSDMYSLLIESTALAVVIKKGDRSFFTECCPASSLTYPTTCCVQ